MEETDLDLHLESTPEVGDPNAQRLAAEEEAKQVERVKRERECKELSIRYSLPTRIGQWINETTLTEEKCKEYEKRREACLTFYQKQSLVIDHLFASVKIAKHENQLMFDLPIQIQSDVALEVPEDKVKPVIQLSVLITELLIDTTSMLKLCPGSLVTASYDKARLRRNVFTCVSVTPTNPRTPVLYGQDFYIRVFDSEGPELYLTGNVPHVDNFGETKGKIPVGLTEKPDRFAKFHIVDPNPFRMITLHGTPVPNFTVVTISQTITNQLLAVELSEKITTSFAVDHPVDCFTHKDSQRRITSANYWKFVTQAIDEGAGDAEAETEGAGPSTS